MKKLLVYPFNKNFCPMARYSQMLESYEQIAAVPPKGFGWKGKDTCGLDGGAPTGVLLRENFSDALAECDAVLFNETIPDMKMGCEENKALAQAAGKRIHILPQASPIQFEETFESDMPLMEIPVPVILVMGQGENCQKFDIQLGLRRAFQKEGYKVSQFGTKAYSDLFGFQPLPGMPELPLWKKIYLYNRLFKETCTKEQPDVMIIGVPGGIMPINAYSHELFGETALAISSAARPDAALLSYYFIEPTPEYFDLLRNYMQFRLGVAKVFYHASNTQFVEDKSTHRLGYLTLESSFVLDMLARSEKDMPANLYNALVPQSSEPAYRSVMEKLQQNVCVL